MSGRLHRVALTTLPQASVAGELEEVGLSTPLHEIGGLLHEVTLESSGIPFISVRAGQTGLEPGTTVALTGTLVNGTAAGYVWRQISGPTVTITDDDQVEASYVAPASLAGAEVSFGLRALDSLGRYSDELTITDTVMWATERAFMNGGLVPAALYLVGS